MSDGIIYNPDLYSKTQNMSSAGWAGILPRHITPSDIDMIFDNRGKLLFCEYKSFDCKWEDLSTGQKALYQHIIENGVRDDGKHKHSVALCYHSLPEGRDIDTRRDVISFRWIYWNNGKIVQSPIMTDWTKFIKWWYSP
jgi:hypothetical protein